MKEADCSQLMLADRARLAIQLGEGQFREFKSALERSSMPPRPRDSAAIARDVGDTLVAFANADGGELLLGVEDDGRLTGLPHAEDRMQVILDAPKTHVLTSTPLQGVTRAILNLDGLRLIRFHVPKSTTQIHQTSDGRCLQRVNTDNVPAQFEQLTYERAEKLSREYDRGFIDGATLADLDGEILSATVGRVSAGTSVDKFLQYLDLLTYEGGLCRLRRAALLLFAKDVTRWHPRCQLRLLRILGDRLQVGADYNVQRDEVVSGCILKLIEEAWSALRAHLAIERFSDQGIFRERVLYPETACQEAIINAIAHRDYANEGSGIEVFIFNDRMEIASPGGLLSGVSVDMLRNAERIHLSRNAYISRVLRELGYMREMGEGIPRIFRALEDRDMVPPDFTANPYRFSITLHNRSIFSQKDRAWLESFEGIPISRDEQRVLVFVRNGKEVSPAAIQSALSMTDWEECHTLLSRMMIKGLVYYTKSNTQATNEVKKLRQTKRNVRRRDIARLAAHTPAECVGFLREFLMQVRRFGKSLPSTVQEVASFKKGLSEKNPLGTSIPMSLVYLELVNEDRSPTPRLFKLLDSLPKVQEPETQKPAPRAEEVPDQEKLGMLVYEVSEIVDASDRKDGGAPLSVVVSKLSTSARQVVTSLSGRMDLVDFLSRRADRFKLKWDRNRWVIYRVR